VARHGPAREGAAAHHRGRAPGAAPVRGELFRVQGDLSRRGGGAVVGMSIQSIKGTKDLLPDEIAAWHRIEGVARALVARYGYRRIRTPIFEKAELFARGIGTETDIVSKEMYTFEDRDERRTSLTLRPEATAGIVRAVIQHNLMNTDPALKVYAIGPMFRREQ